MPIIKFSGVVHEILQATEFLTIVTSGEHGPYIAGSWGDYLRALQSEWDTIVLPAGRYWQTEKILLKGTSKNSMPLGPVRVCCPDGMILGD